MSLPPAERRLLTARSALFDAAIQFADRGFRDGEQMEQEQRELEDAALRFAWAELDYAREVAHLERSRG